MTFTAPPTSTPATRGSIPSFDVVDPTTGGRIAVLEEMDAAAAAAVAAAAARAQRGWAATPWAERAALLDALADELDRRTDRLVELAFADVGTAQPTLQTTQVGAASARLRRVAALPESLLDEPTPDEAGLAVDVTRQPVGPTACIAPYNFPLLAMVAKVAPALLAGNAVVMKPAPQDPLLVVELADAAAAVGFPDGVIGLALGSAPEVGAVLVDSPDIAMVSFTGSTSVGQAIYRAGAATMKRLLLELGGKGAMIVDDAEALPAAVRDVTRTFTVNSGQVCLTPSRLLVPPHLLDDAVGRLRAVMAEQRLGDPRDPAVTMGPLISAAQRDRVVGMVDRAHRAGAEVIVEGFVPDDGFFVAPTLVVTDDPRLEIAQDEVFGPVLTVIGVEGDEAVEVANGTVFGLHDYVYATDAERASSIARRLHSGGVSVNTTARHPGAPFGGWKMSGIGRSGGTHAVVAYTELHAVVRPAADLTG